MFSSVAANLLVNTCHSSFLLASIYDQNTFWNTEEICTHVALALQAKKDLEPFENNAIARDISLKSILGLLPVIFHPAHYSHWIALNDAMKVRRVKLMQTLLEWAWVSVKMKDTTSKITKSH